MRRIGLAVVLAVSLALAPFAAESQQAAKVSRIGYLSPSTTEFDRSWLAAFEQGLRGLGYVEGKNVVIERRHAGGRLERLPELATELIRLNVDVIVVYGHAAIDAVKKVSSTVPIVMTVHSDPVRAGFVASLAHPGGQATGLSDLHGAAVTKRLQLLKEVVPSASRVAVLLNPAFPQSALQLKDLQAAAPAVGVALLPLEVKGPEDIERAFTTIGKEFPGGLFIVAEATVIGTYQRRIADLALKNRLPAIGTVPQFAHAGFLMSYGTDFHDLWRRAATYVDKILNGAKPGDLPIEQASKWELVINLKTAKALGLTIPQTILLQADQVIQ